MSETLTRLEKELEGFRRLADGGVHQYAWCATHDGGRHGHHVVFASMVHGNEVGSLPAVVRVVEALRAGQLSFGGRISFFVGNPEAGRAGVRFLEADLNRVFLPNPHQKHEHVRARQIMPILGDADVFIDFHQTIQPTRNPFYIFPWSESGWHWARALAAAPVWVTRSPGQTFSEGTCCADEFVRNQGSMGLTVELSQAGFSQQAEDIAARTMVRCLEIVDLIVSTGAPSLQEMAFREPDVDFVRTIHQEQFTSPNLALRVGLDNFQPVKSGELVSAPGTPALEAPVSGQLLFPKYPARTEGQAHAPLPKEIFRVVELMLEHPTQVWGHQSPTGSR